MIIAIPDTLLQFKTELQAFKPESQNKIKYNSQTWQKRITHPSLDKIVEQFPTDISRLDAINLAKQAIESNAVDDMITAFIGTIIWGYGKNGRGPWRTNQMLSDIRLESTIQNTFNLIADSNIKTAWQDFNITWCGSAFFTKFFYFVGIAYDIDTYPLVLDSYVRNALIKLIGTSAPSLNTAKDYLSYVTMCHTWANEMECRADAIEYILFSQPAGLFNS